MSRVVADPPPGVTLGLHMCRSNNFRFGPARHRATGGYDPVAEKLFSSLAVSAFFLEYDTPRSGDFSPLRFLPKGKRAVLGLISTKVPELEHEDELLRRIEEASAFIDVDQLGISPQCGFSSGFKGHPCTIDQQVAKLELAMKVA